MSVFFTSDLHFGHENVITFDNRPFKSVDEMDACLIEKWNKKVSKGDVVYVLGDLIWKTKNDEALSIINKLNGQIILIRGNHDKFLSNSAARKALAGVKDYDDICVVLKDGTKKRVIMSHYYIPLYNGHRYGAIHLHGHSHVTDENDIEIEMSNLINSKGYNTNVYNVGCMHWNYEPVTLDEILSKNDAI